MNYSKKHLNRYYTFCIVLFSIYLFILFFSLFLHSSLLTIFIGTLLYFPLAFAIRWFSFKNFFDILCNEKDSREFYNTIHRHPLRPSLIYRLHAEWYTGNYKKLIALSQAGYRTSDSIRVKVTCLVFLSRAYFELHNIDKLKEVTDAFFELKETYSNKKKLFFNYNTFQFYNSFINGNYAECIELVDVQLNYLDMQKNTDELQFLTQKSNRAICLYWQGEKQEAKELFEDFKLNYPALENFNGLADRYLLAIESDNSSVLDVLTPDITDEEDFEKQFLTLKNKKKKKQIILSILFFIVLSVLISLQIMDYTDKIKSQSNYENDIIEYENDLKIAVKRKYGNANCIKYFDLTDKTQYIDTFCLIEVNGRLDLVSIVTFDNGDTLDLILLLEGIQISNHYSVKSAVSNHQIDFSISNTQISTSNSNEPIEFSLNNKNYWIVIENIRPIN